MRGRAKRSSTPTLLKSSNVLGATEIKAPGKRRPRRKAKKSRKRSGARLPGMKGGAVLEDAPKCRPYQSKEPGFPLERAEVIPLCQERPLICAGQVLALMDFMEARQCTMNHLHDMSKIGYATIYNFLQLATFPGTPVLVKLVLALGCDYVNLPG